jgi:hypothetical protein
MFKMQVESPINILQRLDTRWEAVEAVRIFSSYIVMRIKGEFQSDD